MASSYALPASAMTHSHGHGHTHLHSHSHSHSPGRQHPPSPQKALRSDRSNGSLHSHSHSEPRLDHGHNNNHNHSHSHSSSPSRGHSYMRELSTSSYLPTPPNSNGMSPISEFPKQLHQHEPSPALSQMGPFEPSLNAVNVISHSHEHDHLHNHALHVEQPRSKFTSLLLPFAMRWPLLHTILADKDSRRIFYFMSLNFAFMIVQACYGFLTDSLGLLSDSIHMFFDCLALGVGLFAAVASKWPPSERFPYGFGKIESLSGFGNGVFLMLISVEIMIEATERLAEGRETKRLAELFVVSAMGLAVNLVGMACFGHHGHHGHHGHDHGGHSHGHGGHDHGHSHSHSHEKEHPHDHHDHDHVHDHDHDCKDGHGHTPLLSDSPPAKAHAHVGHAHSHDNENMHGIFLHVLADTMGSAAVMVSTALIYFFGWNGWDPLASCVIAILIFLSSIPLIKSSAKKLLLTVPDEIEYGLRDTLAGVSDLRGVATYTVPRFWMGDKNTDSESEQVLGVIHIVATRGSDLDDVRERTRDFLLNHGIDVVVQVEKGEDTSCWCGGSSTRSPVQSLY
ncbi:cation efflux family-domain-containing protein [Rhexocercosporidium sp. MPI-PUGE-AT-0058]|nr:cation efflux family-domain-containing protein [Rhexocercosporidium sp. MPI-PUGE-AT-0058]